MMNFTHKPIPFVNIVAPAARKKPSRSQAGRGLLACVALLTTFFGATANVGASLSRKSAAPGIIFADTNERAFQPLETSIHGVVENGRWSAVGSAAMGPNGGIVCGNPGELDPTFGTGGKVITPIGSLNDDPAALTLQPDGKMIVAGHTQTAAGYDIAILRLNADGSLDPAFGIGGKVITDTGNADFAQAAAVQNDGKIVIAGFSGVQNGPYDFLLLRYNADGTLDQSFGTGGKVVTNIANSDRPWSMAIQADGKLVLAGVADSEALLRIMVVARYNPDGSLDTGFGSGGMATVPAYLNYSTGSVAIDAVGRIIAASSGRIVRFNSDGSPDQTFGNGGVATFQVGTSSMALQADGRIVVVDTFSFGVGRLNTDGSPDTTFGPNGQGYVYTPVGISTSKANSVAIQKDGRIVAAGYATANGQSRDFTLVRYNSNGSLDATFGSGGVMSVPMLGSVDELNGVVILPDGRIAAAGQVRNGTSDFGIVRHLAAACEPEITVAQPELTYLTDNSSFDFGVGNVGSANPAKTFTIRNDGTSLLTLGAVTVTGTNAGDFVIDTSGMASTLAPGAVTTFNVTFTPGSSGSRAASLRIDNGDPDENPFDLSLKGRGLTGVIYTLNVTAVKGKVFSNPTGINCPGDCSESYDQGYEAVLNLRAVPQNGYKFVGWTGDASGNANPLSVPLNANKNITAVFIPVTLFDVDADTKADLSVWRPSNNFWYSQTETAFSFREFGQPGDKLVPADYDGDSKTDIAVWRPSTGQWFYIGSANQSFNVRIWGQQGDIPIPLQRGLAVFRPSEGRWLVLNGGSQAEVSFGAGTFVPVRGDFDGDGQSDPAVYNTTDHTWRIARLNGSFFVTTWGQDGDIPVPGDYDGDGSTDIAVWRPSTGQWYIVGSTNGWMIFTWGVTGDKPVPADYDGDGRWDVAVFRPSDSTWYVVNSSTSGFYIRQFGAAGDIPTASAYIY